MPRRGAIARAFLDPLAPALLNRLIRSAIDYRQLRRILLLPVTLAVDA
ncbi:MULTISPECIES: hypothetical protein [unclassified Bosea (in: a-proteobacteria)]|nr:MULTISPECIES: hypothetical protein [unclassified Bosea (in: a-proteobacteria)]